MLNKKATKDNKKNDISDNNIASYFLFAGSDGLMSDMIDSQWQMDLE